ncbi:hypothetical protein K474DRAFT_1714113 [Panus rudis PR-1116 ss-1]|nr:hypothetical protein K474DRAFT_1714113 [Panus rudis PR-1116 ss-1]
MIVVDPMHNLFLGLVKIHFYAIWVKLNVLCKTKELRRLHALLAELSIPVKLGRLPSLVGEPAGGSLTADQWRILATVVGPLVRASKARTKTRAVTPQDPRSSGPVRRTARLRQPSKRLQEAQADDNISDENVESDSCLDDGAIELEGEEYEPESGPAAKWRKLPEDSEEGDRGPMLHPNDVSNFLEVMPRVTVTLEWDYH